MRSLCGQRGKMMQLVSSVTTGYDNSWTEVLADVFLVQKQLIPLAQLLQ